MPDQLLCAYCHKPIEQAQDHVRQARLVEDPESGSLVAEKGSFDAYHVRPCYLELYGIQPPAETTQEARA